MVITQGLFLGFFLDLHLSDSLAKGWDRLVGCLYQVGIYLFDTSDILVWSCNKGSGEVNAKLAYKF